MAESRETRHSRPRHRCLAAFQVGLFCGFRVVANGSLVARELVHVSPARTGSLLHASVTIWCACCGAAWGCLISKGNKQPQLLLTLTSFLLLASLEHSMASCICIHTSFHFSESMIPVHGNTSAHARDCPAPWAVPRCHDPELL
mgnify:CR=1 FL=1